MRASREATSGEGSAGCDPDLSAVSKTRWLSVTSSVTGVWLSAAVEGANVLGGTEAARSISRPTASEHKMIKTVTNSIFLKRMLCLPLAPGGKSSSRLLSILGFGLDRLPLEVRPNTRGCPPAAKRQQ